LKHPWGRVLGAVDLTCIIYGLSPGEAGSGSEAERERAPVTRSGGCKLSRGVLHGAKCIARRNARWAALAYWHEINSNAVNRLPPDEIFGWTAG